MDEFLTFAFLFLIAIVGYVFGYAVGAEDAYELKRAEHWGCEAPAYIGPTGGNHSVTVYELPPYRWLDGTTPGAKN